MHLNERLKSVLNGWSQPSENLSPYRITKVVCSYKKKTFFFSYKAEDTSFQDDIAIWPFFGASFGEP